MNIATQNTLTKVYNWFAYVFFPFLIIGWYYYTDAPIDAIIENNAWFILPLFMAGAFDGAMDIVKDKFDESVFKNFNRMFWDGKISDLNKYIMGDSTRGRRKLFKIIPIPVVFTDAWHFFKGTKTICFCLFGVLLLNAYSVPGNLLCKYLFFYVIYKWGFNLFYNIILKRG